MSSLGEWDPEAPVAPFGDEEPAPLHYPTLVVFVEEFLVDLYRRPLGSTSVAWCAEWWRHPEAITRLEALWRAFEYLRLDPATGISVWLRDHVDPHMSVLLSPDGPFKACRVDDDERGRGHSNSLKPLPVITPPPGLFA